MVPSASAARASDHLWRSRGAPISHRRPSPPRRRALRGPSSSPPCLPGCRVGARCPPCGGCGRCRG
eukprot:13283206-Alexandrium_andersonii.AAC.1